MVLPRFVRSLVSGGAATLVDLGVLTFLTAVCTTPARLANLPALVAGGVVTFALNRSYAFEAKHGPLAEHVTLFAIVEVLALAWNGLLFDVGLRLVPSLATHPLGPAIVRLVTSHLVFVAWSYPLWRWVFRPRHARV
jgi:putative flippase GtrA